MTDPARYVIDTSVLLHDIRVIDGFMGIECEEADSPRELLLPIYALEELDLHKEELNERGQKAREIVRRLDVLRRGGSLYAGIEVRRLTTLRVVETSAPLPMRLRKHPQLIYDWLILHCAKEHQASLITKDSNLRVRADSMGIVSTDWVELSTERERKSDISYTTSSLTPHHQKVWGLEPRSDEQAIALGALLDPEISLVTLTGKAGTGKTLLALAAGLAQVTEREEYERVLVSRAIFPLGRDIGYLPGTIEEKMEPWLQPIYDNLDFLLSQRERRQSHRPRPRAEELVDMGLIEVAPITFIRGRSIPRQYLIIDEAQNLTPHEVKTMLTRAGEGAKVVLIGDPHQVDHPYLDPENNGLRYVARRFSHQECAAHLHLTKGERSRLAELAADLL